MIINFRHKGLKRFFETENTAGIKPQYAHRLKLILSRLDASQEPRDMNLPGLKLHKLVGEYKGYFSVTVNANWRIIYRYEHLDVYDVDLIDYH